MSVYFGHDIFEVPACKKVPKRQWIVRPCGQKSMEGFRGEFDSFAEAHEKTREFTSAVLFNKAGNWRWPRALNQVGFSTIPHEEWELWLR